MLTKLLDFVNIFVVTLARSPGGQELLRTEILPFRDLCPQSHVAGGKMLPVVPAGRTGRTFYLSFIQKLNH